MERSHDREIDSGRRWMASASPWRITLVYVGLSVAWILGSDEFFSRLFDGRTLALVQTVKGVFWVVSSALLLHYLVFRHIRKIQRIEAEARRRLDQGELVGRFGTAELIPGTPSMEWSEGMYRILGLDPRGGVPSVEWIGQRIDREDLERVRRTLEALLSRGVSPPPFDVRVHLDDGRTRIIRIFAHAVQEGQRVRVIVTAQDVTELREAELGERTNLSLLRSVVEASAAGLLVVRQSSREILLWNDRYSELLDVPRELLERGDAEEALGQMLHRMKDAEHVRERIDEIYSQPELACFDRVETANGRILERYTAPVFLEGIPQARIWSYRDITDRSRGEDALRLAEERYRAVFEQAPVGIAEISRELRVIRANRELQRAFGIGADALVGTPVLDLMHPEDAEGEARELASLVSGAAVASTAEKRYRRSDGTFFWAEVTISPVRARDEVAYLIAAVHDVTDRHVMEDERERLVRDVRLLLESTGAGLFASDLLGRCTLVNRAACEILGYSADDLLGAPIEEIIVAATAGAAPDPFQAAIGRLREEGSARLYNHSFRRRNGSAVLCDVTISPIARFGEVIGRAVSFIDVSDRRALEDRLERAERLTSLGRLAASIAHEMNNVLMGILPFAEIVSRSPGERESRAGEQIRNSVQRGRSITQEILHYARPAEPEKTRIEVCAWIRSLGRELEQIVKGRGAWIVDLPSEPVWIHADPGQLAQVFTNLVLNARDALRPGGSVSLNVRRPAPGETLPFGFVPRSTARWILMSVRDDGVGMDADTLRQLFEPFFTLKRGGTGLGLPIALQTVGAHGGHLFVESVEGIGSAFHVLLPEAYEAEDSATLPAPMAPREIPADILLVEDDEGVAAGLIASFEDAGASPALAATGARAIEILRGHRPDVVVLDVGLPDMDGAAVCEQALSIWPGLPVIFSTGHGDAVRLGRFLARPHVRFLTKPYTFDELLDAIHDATAAAAAAAAAAVDRRPPSA
ncbi:MAG TPA: PAS domain S-box protein [Thermoanaerobaculia bacterium]|nr:PAS domain S-box protein [Thermoanaerobaculia bacterium]